MKLSIVTVTWKSKEDVKELIHSIHQNTHIESYEIIVVDNNSNDGTVEMLRSDFPEVLVVANDDNRGYAGGMNQGYKLASGEYLVFMNPDMKLSQPIFEHLIESLNNDPRIGIIAPQLRYEDGSVQPTIKRRPTLASQIPILFKLHHFFNFKATNRYLGKDIDYTQSQDALHLMGAFICSSRKNFEKFGPWDEDYPLWWEDEQLSEDSLQHGFKNFYTTEVWLTHYEGKSFAQVLSLAKQKRFNKGMRIYFLKNNGILSYLLLLILHPLSLLLAWITQILKIRPRSQSKATLS